MAGLYDALNSLLADESQPAPAPVQLQPTQPGTPSFMENWDRSHYYSVRGQQADTVRAKAAYARALGDLRTDALLRQQADLMDAETARTPAPVQPDFTSIDSFSKAGDFLSSGIGQLTGSLEQMAPYSLGGALAGALLNRVPVVGPLLGASGSKIGGLLGTQYASAMPQTGETYKEQLGEHVDPETAALASIARGQAAGALDTMGGVAALLGAKRLLTGAAKNRALEVGKAGLFEGITETGQDVTADIANAAVGLDVDPFSEKSLNQKLNSFVVGALGGTAFSGAPALYDAGKSYLKQRADQRAVGGTGGLAGEPGENEDNLGDGPLYQPETERLRILDSMLSYMEDPEVWGKQGRATLTREHARNLVPYVTHLLNSFEQDSPAQAQAAARWNSFINAPSGAGRAWMSQAGREAPSLNEREQEELQQENDADAFQAAMQAFVRDRNQALYEGEVGAVGEALRRAGIQWEDEAPDLTGERASALGDNATEEELWREEWSLNEGARPTFLGQERNPRAFYRPGVDKTGATHDGGAANAMQRMQANDPEHKYRTVPALQAVLAEAEQIENRTEREELILRRAEEAGWQPSVSPEQQGKFDSLERLYRRYAQRAKAFSATGILPAALQDNLRRVGDRLKQEKQALAKEQRPQRIEEAKEFLRNQTAIRKDPVSADEDVFEQRTFQLSRNDLFSLDQSGLTNDQVRELQKLKYNGTPEQQKLAAEQLSAHDAQRAPIIVTSRGKRTAARFIEGTDKDGKTRIVDIPTLVNRMMSKMDTALEGIDLPYEERLLRYLETGLAALVDNPALQLQFKDNLSRLAPTTIVHYAKGGEPVTYGQLVAARGKRQKGSGLPIKGESPQSKMRGVERRLAELEREATEGIAPGDTKALADARERIRPEVERQQALRQSAVQEARTYGGPAATRAMKAFQKVKAILERLKELLSTKGTRPEVTKLDRQFDVKSRTLEAIITEFHSLRSSYTLVGKDAYRTWDIGILRLLFANRYPDLAGEIDRLGRDHQLRTVVQARAAEQGVAPNSAGWNAIRRELNIGHEQELRDAYLQLHPEHRGKVDELPREELIRGLTWAQYQKNGGEAGMAQMKQRLLGLKEELEAREQELQQIFTELQALKSEAKSDGVRAQIERAEKMLARLQGQYRKALERTWEDDGSSDGLFSYTENDAEWAGPGAGVLLGSGTSLDGSPSVGPKVIPEGVDPETGLPRFRIQRSTAVDNTGKVSADVELRKVTSQHARGAGQYPTGTIDRFELLEHKEDAAPSSRQELAERPALTPEAANARVAANARATRAKAVAKANRANHLLDLLSWFPDFAHEQTPIVRRVIAGMLRANGFPAVADNVLGGPQATEYDAKGEVVASTAPAPRINNLKQLRAALQRVVDAGKYVHRANQRERVSARQAAQQEYQARLDAQYAELEQAERANRTTFDVVNKFLAQAAKLLGLPQLRVLSVQELRQAIEQHGLGAVASKRTMKKFSGAEGVLQYLQALQKGEIRATVLAGRAVIVMSPSLTDQLMAVTVMAHEVGHMVWNIYKDKAPPAVMEAFREWRRGLPLYATTPEARLARAPLASAAAAAERRIEAQQAAEKAEQKALAAEKIAAKDTAGESDKARAHAARRAADAAQKVVDDLRGGLATEYDTGFNEWFADNVARWFFASQKPRTIVDQFFADLAGKLKALFEYTSAKLKELGFRGYNDNPDSSVTEFLNDLVAQQEARAHAERLAAQARAQAAPTSKPQSGTPTTVLVPKLDAGNLTKADIDENTVVVVGTRRAAEGRGYSGSAALAVQLGVTNPLGNGRLGAQVFGIETVQSLTPSKPAGQDTIRQGFEQLYAEARANPEKLFLLTKVGTKRAGFTEAQIKALLPYGMPRNIVTPTGWERYEAPSKPQSSTPTTVVNAAFGSAKREQLLQGGAVSVTRETIYGNPFGVSGIATRAQIPNAGTVAEVSGYYRDWLKGTLSPVPGRFTAEDLKRLEKKRQEILAKFPDLVGKQLVYYRDTGAETNHAKELAALVNDWAQQRAAQAPIIFSQYQGAGRRGGVEQNVQQTDITIALAADFAQPGAKIITELVRSNNKAYAAFQLTSRSSPSDGAVAHLVDVLNKTGSWLGKSLLRLNLVGNNAHIFANSAAALAQAQVDNYVFDLLNRVSQHPNLKVGIQATHSGGQSGVEEAAVKASSRLGIPSTILASKDWGFTRADGTKAADEAEFKSRFGAEAQDNLGEENEDALGEDTDLQADAQVAAKQLDDLRAQVRQASDAYIETEDRVARKLYGAENEKAWSELRGLRDLIYDDAELRNALQQSNAPAEDIDAYITALQAARDADVAAESFFRKHKSLLQHAPDAVERFFAAVRAKAPRAGEAGADAINFQLLRDIYNKGKAGDEAWFAKEIAGRRNRLSDPTRYHQKTRQLISREIEVLESRDISATMRDLAAKHRIDYGPTAAALPYEFTLEAEQRRAQPAPAPEAAPAPNAASWTVANAKAVVAALRQGRPELLEQITRLHAMDMNAGEITAKLGISPEVVRDARVGLGLPDQGKASGNVAIPIPGDAEARAAFVKWSAEWLAAHPEAAANTAAAPAPEAAPAQSAPTPSVPPQIQDTTPFEEPQATELPQPADATTQQNSATATTTTAPTAGTAPSATAQPQPQPAAAPPPAGGGAPPGSGSGQAAPPPQSPPPPPPGGQAAPNQPGQGPTLSVAPGSELMSAIQRLVEINSRFARLTATTAVDVLSQLDALISNTLQGPAVQHLRNIFASELLTREERKLLLRASSHYSVKAQIRRQLAGNPDLIEQMDRDPVTGVALMYILAKAKIIRVGPETLETFSRFTGSISDAITNITGYRSDFDNFAALFAAIDNNAVANRYLDPQNSMWTLPPDLRHRLHQRMIQGAVNKYNRYIGKYLERFNQNIYRRMMDTDNAHLQWIAQQFFTASDATFSNNAYLTAQRMELARFHRALRAALGPEGNNKRFMASVREALYSPTAYGSANQEVKDAVDRLKNEFFPKFADYLEGAGVLKDRRKNYVPWVIDLNYLEQNMDEWNKLLLQPQYQPHLEKLRERIGRQLVAALYKQYLRAAPPDPRVTEKEWRRALKELAKQEAQRLTPTLDQVPAYVAQRIMAAHGYADSIELEDLPTHNPSFRFMNARDIGFIESAGTPADMDRMAKFLDKDLNTVLHVYMTQGTKRAEFARRFGVKGEVLRQQLEDAKAAGATNEELQMAHDFVNAMLGMHGAGTKERIDRLLERIPMPARWRKSLQAGGIINPKLQKLMSGIMVYQNLRLLGLATLSSFADIAGIAVRSGSLVTMTRALKESVRAIANQAEGDTDALASMADMLGTIDKHMVSDLLAGRWMGVDRAQNKINEFFFKAIGLEHFTRFTRLMATSAAQTFITRHVKRPNAHSQRYLDELNLNPADVQFNADGSIKLLTDVQRESATLEDLRRDNAVRAAIHQFVETSVLRPDAAQRPLWMSDPHFMLFGHLKSFMFSFHERVLTRVLHEARYYGDFTPMLMMTLYLPIVAAADELRELIQYGPGRQAGYKYNFDVFDHMAHLVRRTGVMGRYDMAMGPFGDWDMGGFGFESLLGPTSGIASEALRGQLDLEEVFPLQNVWKHWNDKKAA